MALEFSDADVGIAPARPGELSDAQVFGGPPTAAKRPVGLVEAGLRGAGEALAGQGQVLGLAASTAASINPVLRGANAILNRVRGEDVPVSDRVFGAFVDPAKAAAEGYAPQASEGYGIPQHIARGAGAVAGMLPGMVASGGAQGTTMMPAVLANAVRGAAIAQPTFAVPQTVLRAGNLLEQGVAPADVAKASAVNLATNTVQGALPVAVPGGILKRIATGAAINPVAGAAGRSAESAVLGSENARVHQPAFSPEASIPEAVLGGVMGGAFGSRPLQPVSIPKRPELTTEPGATGFQPSPSATPRTFDPAEQVKQVQAALYGVPSDAPQPPAGLSLVSRKAPMLPAPEPDVSASRPPVAPEWTTEGAPRQPAREPGLDAQGREIPLDAAEAQRITTEPSPELIPAERAAPAPEAPREGRTVSPDMESLPASPARLAPPRDPIPAERQIPREVMTPMDREAAPAPAAQSPEQRAGNRGAPFLTAIIKAGGIDPRDAPDMVGERGAQANRMRPGLFRKGGMSGDGLREWLVDNGYMSDAEMARHDRETPGGAIEVAMERVRSALRGDEQLRAGDEVAGYEAARDAEWREHERRMAEDHAYAAEDARLRAEALKAEQVAADEAQARVEQAARLDEAAVEDAARRFGDDERGFMAEVERIIRDGEAKSKEPADAPAGRSEAGQRDAPGARAGEDAGQAGGRPAYDLEQPSEAGLRERAARDERARSERERVEAAPRPEDFTLTGSDRPADEAAARGQQELPGNTAQRASADVVDIEMARAARRMDEVVRQDFLSTWDGLKTLHAEGRATLDDINRALEIARNGSSQREIAIKTWKLFVEIQNRQRGPEAANDSAPKGTTLFAGPPVMEMLAFAADRVKAIAGDWKPAALQLKKSAQAVAEAFGARLSGEKGAERAPQGGESLPAAVARTVLYNSHSHIKSFGEAWKSPTIRKIADMIYSTAGEAQEGQAFHEAAGQHVTARQGAISGITRDLDALVKSSGVTEAQIVKMVENPAARQGKAGEVATRIADWLKAEYAYLKAAGVDIGNVKDYFPRVYDRARIVQQRAAFEADATRAYERMGLSGDEAHKAARAFWFREAYGSDGSPGFTNQAAGGEKFAKVRELTPEAAEQIRKWRVEGVADTLTGYLAGATKRAEIARRFGDKWSGWDALEKQIIKEAPDIGADQLRELRGMVASAMGLRPSTMGAAAHTATQYLRLWTTLATMPKAALSSISETWMPIARANGDVAVQLSHLRNALVSNANSLLQQAVGMGRSERMQRMFDFAEDVGAISQSPLSHLMADRWMGSDVNSQRVNAISTKFFRLNMLEQVTNWQRALAVDAGRVWMRRLAKRVDGEGWGGGKSADFFLRELGVPADKVEGFAEWVRGMGDELPDAGNLAGEYGAMYRNALVRFTDQAIQRPTAATRPSWANTEWGAVVFQLQGFANAFHKNVLLRQANLMREGATGDYGKMERLAMIGGMAPGLVMAAATAGMMWELRDKMFSKGEPRERTTQAKVERAISGAGLYGAADPWIQMLGGVRYNRALSSQAAGPAFGGVEQAVTTAAQYWFNNSEKTNAAERKAADTFYQWALEPAATLALAATPAPVAPATQALTIWAIPAAKAHFTDAVAGPKDRSREKPIRGIFEPKP